MKKFHFLILICILLCAILAMVLVGCNNNALARPEGLKLDGPTLTLSWKANDKARYFVVNVSGNGVNEDRTTMKNSYSLSSFKLSEGDYQVKVKAFGDGKTFKNSAWSAPIAFSQDPDTGLTFRFINKNTEVEVASIGRANGVIVIPDTYRGLPVTQIGANAFSGKSLLKELVLGNNVKSIGEGAFYRCTYLTKITFSDSLESIGKEAFMRCAGLEEVIKLPKNLTVIGEGVFEACTALKGIQFNEKLETIGAKSFAYCSAIETLNIPDSVQTVGDSAFYQCENLKSVQLGKGVKLIDEYAFWACGNLARINFNEKLETIGSYAFGRCKKLASVTLMDNVQSIGEGTFYQCEMLSKVTLGKGIQKIGNGAFLQAALWTESQSNEIYVGDWFVGCKDNKISSITIKEGTVGLANSSLSGFESLTTTVFLPNSLKIIGDGTFAKSKVTAVVIGSGVEEIGVQAFYNCTMLGTVILGSYDPTSGGIAQSSLKTIKEYAFMGCTQLANIDIPSSVEAINTYAFNGSALYKNASNGVAYAGKWVVGCDNTRANGVIVIEEGTVGIANYAFYQCSNITGVEIPDSVKSIGRSAFYQCSKLAAVKLPSALEVIEDYTFYDCSALILPELPKTLKTIGRSAFYKCGLYNANGTDTDNDVLEIPDSVEAIGDYAFFGCGYVSYDLENMSVLKCGIDVVKLGNGVKTIGSNAFNTIATLKKVIFGDSVKTVGAKAFYLCEALSEVEFNSGLESIGVRAFYGCNKLTTLNLPQSLTDIENYAFYRCTGLTDVNFGNNLQNVGDFAFYGCTGLEKLSLPNSVKSIGKQAFRGCASLQSIVLGSGVETIDMHAFYGCKNLTIFAQSASAPEGWNARFNSSYRPIVWNCTVKDGYVYSLTKNANTIGNLYANNTLSAPQRDGYEFAGWATKEGATVAEYSMENLAEIKNGTKLFAVWTEITENIQEEQA